MRSSFFGFNVAVTGLYTAQRNLDVINNNISNVNTPGYSRQQTVQQALRPMNLYDGTGMIGTGVEVTAVKRVRDEYLDTMYWSENVTFGEWDTKRTLLSELEATFNEPSNSGFTQIMDEFFSSLQELSKDPSSEAVRALVKERGVTLAKYFNDMATRFEELQVDINDRIETTVERINSIGVQIQQLNKQIYTVELDGSTANELRDQRTLLIDELSKLINIEVNEVAVGKLPSGRDDVRMTITISGKAFIDHFNLSKLALVQRENKLNEGDVPNLFDIKWEDGNSLKITGGVLRGYLDVRDGNSGLNGSPVYKGIPDYIRKLNQFVQTFAMAFNEGYIDLDNDGVIDPVKNPAEDGKGHVDGYGIGSAADLGIRFFTMLGTENKSISSSDFIGGASDPAAISARYSNITAKNFAVSSDILDNINLIATSDTKDQVGNINNLRELMKLRNNDQMFVEGAPEDFMKSIVTTLGVSSQQAVRISANQEVIVKQVENRRLSESGVSLDEEVANMVKHQQAYSAAAQMINTMAEIYDILINRVGV